MIIIKNILNILVQTRKTTEEKGLKIMSRIYLRMKKKITMEHSDKVQLHHIALIDAPNEDKEKLKQIPIHTITQQDGEFIVIEAFMLLSILRRVIPDYEVELIGPEESIIEIKPDKYKPSFLFMALVWIILFVGTAMSIMNFHYDVSMPEVHEKLHYIFTGEKNDRPLWIQIPYSIGLGIGMIIFLNHWFKKRINEEPSPLEIELFKYEKDIEAYVRHYENELNDDERHF